MFSHTSTTRKGQIAAVVPTYSQAEHRSGKFVTLTVRLSMTVAISNSSVLKTMTVLGGKLESLTICTVSRSTVVHSRHDVDVYTAVNNILK